MHYAYYEEKWNCNKFPFLQTIYFNIGHDWLKLHFTGSPSHCADQYGLTSQAQGAYIHILSGTWYTWAQYRVKMQWLSEFLVAFLRKQDESHVLYHKTCATAQNRHGTCGSLEHMKTWLADLEHSSSSWASFLREDIQWLEILHQISCLRSFLNLNSLILSSKYFIIKHSVIWYWEAITDVLALVEVFYASLWTWLFEMGGLPFLACMWATLLDSFLKLVCGLDPFVHTNCEILVIGHGFTAFKFVHSEVFFRCDRMT